MILTPDEFRQHVPTELEDEPLQDLLDGAEESIVGVLGAEAGAQEFLRASGDLLLLSRPAQSITTVLEDTSALVANDYSLRDDGQTLVRLATGDHPSRRWRGRVDLTYVPRDDHATRVRGQVELVSLELNYAPGVKRERIGDWEEEQAAAAESLSYDDMRQAILSSLAPKVVIL